MHIHKHINSQARFVVTGPMIYVSGNLDQMREEMNQPRGAMDDLLHLTDLPDVDGEDVDGTLVHMRVQELVPCKILKGVAVIWG